MTVKQMLLINQAKFCKLLKIFLPWTKENLIYTKLKMTEIVSPFSITYR